MHIYEVRPRRDKRGFDLISDALPFGRLWYGLAEDAVGYAKFYSRSHAMIVRVFDESGGLIKTHESQSAFRDVAVFGIPDPKWGEIVKACRCSQAGENTHRGRANRVLPTIARQFQSSAQHRVLRNRASEKRLRQNPKEVAS